MDVTVDADHMYAPRTTNVLHSIGIWLAWLLCVLYFSLDPFGSIIIGNCTFACLPVGIPTGTSRLLSYWMFKVAQHEDLAVHL